MIPTISRPVGPSPDLVTLMTICQVCVLYHSLRRQVASTRVTRVSAPRECGYAVIIYRVVGDTVPLSEWESARGLTDHTVSARKDVSNVLPQFHGRSCTTQGPRHVSMHLQFPASSSQPRSETWRPRDTRRSRLGASSGE